MADVAGARPPWWLATVTVAGVLGGALSALLLLIAVLAYGFDALAKPDYWLVCALLFGMALVVAGAINVADRGPAAEQRRELHKRTRRQRLPRDLVVLGEASREDWVAWGAKLRALARRRSVVRLPVVLLCGVLASVEFAKYTSGVVRVGLIAIAGAIFLGMSVVAFIAQWSDPLVLVGRIVRDADVLGETAAHRPERSGLANSVVEVGTARTVTIEVRAAAVLRTDGTLRSDPDWRGRHEIGARRGVRRLLRTGDRCVLLCAGDGTALHTLGQFAHRTCGARPAADAPSR
jgi:hypothetical protein